MSDLSRREREMMYWLFGMLQERHGIENIHGGDNQVLPFELTYAAQATVESYSSEIETSSALLSQFYYVFECEWDIGFEEYVELKRNNKWE